MNNRYFYLLPFLCLFACIQISANIDHLDIDPRFKISIFAQDLDSPRQMAEGINGTIFVGERGGQIVQLFQAE